MILLIALRSGWIEVVLVISDRASLIDQVSGRCSQHLLMDCLCMIFGVCID